MGVEMTLRATVMVNFNEFFLVFPSYLSSRTATGSFQAPSHWVESSLKWLGPSKLRALIPISLVLGQV